MGQKSSSLVEGHRLSEHVTLGVLARVVPVDLVDAVLRETGRQNWRARQLLPRVVVYYVMALTLYAHASYDAVLRELVEGLRWLHWDGAALGLACKSAITQARVRLGEAPLRELFRRIARPLAEPGAPGAWYRGRRLVSFDGTTIDVPDLPVLERHFGRPPASRGSSGFPQLRLLALLEPTRSSPRSSPGLRLARSLWRARSWPISSLECCAWPTAPLSATPCGAMPPRPEPTCSGAPAASSPVFSVWTTAHS
jgi:hypothetical protein